MKSSRKIIHLSKSNSRGCYCSGALRPQIKTTDVKEVTCKRCLRRVQEKRYVRADF